MWYNAKLFGHEISNEEKISIDTKRIKNGLQPFWNIEG